MDDKSSTGTTTTSTKTTQSKSGPSMFESRKPEGDSVKPKVPAESIESKQPTKEIDHFGKGSVIISAKCRSDQKKSTRDAIKHAKAPLIRNMLVSGLPISRFRGVHASLSNKMNEQLGKGEDNTRETMVAVAYRAVMAILSFGGAAIFMAIDGHLPAVKVTICDALLKSSNDVCGNITSICTCNGTLGFENCTDATTTSYIDTTLDNTTTSTNISTWLNDTTIFDNMTNDPDQWFGCVNTLGLGGNVPTSFEAGIIFVLTIMATIGYGNIVVTGNAAQAVMVAYSLFLIALFFEFLNGLAVTVCDQIAKLYDRLIRKPCMKKGASEPKLMTLCPDLVPFSFLFLIVATYTIAVSAVFYATMDFTDFGNAAYFMFISVAMIGFGDVVPCDKCQLPAMPFIMLGIILVALITCVQEQWFHQSVVRLVEAMIGTRQERFAEQTLEAMMVPSEGRTKMDDVLKKMAAGEETPYLTVEANDPYNEVVLAKETARMKAKMSVHTRRQFAVRFNVKDLEDDSL